LVHFPNPSMYFRLVERSPGPSTQPIHGSAASRNDPDGMAGSPSKNCSRAARTTADLLTFRCLAARPSLACNPTGNFNEIAFMGNPRGITASALIVIHTRDHSKAAGHASSVNASRSGFGFAVFLQVGLLDRSNVLPVGSGNCQLPAVSCPWSLVHCPLSPVRCSLRGCQRPAQRPGSRTARSGAGSGIVQVSIDPPGQVGHAVGL